MRWGPHLAARIVVSLSPPNNCAGGRESLGRRAFSKKSITMLRIYTVPGLAVLWFVLGGAPGAAAVPAFPGCEGFGCASVGGRGGAVFDVTNINNSGGGSLRACVEATGPRTCVFRRGGTINLTSVLAITNPQITIAGQTAPGGGILLKGSPNYTGSILEISANDAIVRHLRVRAGSTTAPTCCRDSIEILRGQRIVLDHISASWAVDENVSAWEGNAGGPSNITVQWSIISEGLQNSSHQSGAHSTGSLFGLSVRNVTVHHNLFAHNGERNPKFDMSGGVADVVNNLIYNWGDWGGTSISTDFGNYPAIFQANFYKRGPSTPGLTEAPYFEISTGGSNTGSPPARVWLSGNIGPLRPNNSLPQDANVQGDYVMSSSQFSAPQVTVQSASAASNQVLSKAGATQAATRRG